MIAGRPGGSQASDPFGALGLAAGRDLTDDDVRAAWRRIAAATHPDRADGGDPQRFAVAAAAYTALRTASGRGEVLADLAAGQAAGRAWPRRPVSYRVSGRHPAAAVRLTARVRGGRPWRLALRCLAVLAVGATAAAAIGLQPATPALITGAITWLILTGRRDLAPAPRAARGNQL
ncbi:MAG TPA: hypothetical protein VMK13_00950 [Streptosporangiaceae bacterium]|nr:hypothetical protein [Streptosporangiaceae bacterium]